VSVPDGRIVLLVVSARVAPGLLSWEAWQRLVTADAVLVAAADEGWLEAFAAAGITPTDVGDLPVAQRAGHLVETAGPEREVVWLGSPDGDPGLTDALAEHLTRRTLHGRPPEVELLTGAHDVPGARLLDLVAVMDRLRSPGGCPWDADQTHTSLLPYLLEEAHEVVEAVESGDRAHVQEELGDLLLQVIFHARVAEEDDDEPFGIDDVAAGIVAKLIRRHPHVFGDTEVDGADEVSHNWEQIKAAEKQRDGVFDGIPVTLPALARAQKMLSRLTRSVGDAEVARHLNVAAGDDPVAGSLLAAVRAAAAADDDAEAVLRRALQRLVAAVDGAEGGSVGGSRVPA
jgi:XTP/dITP diphosphohydrolase